MTTSENKKTVLRGKRSFLVAKKDIIQAFDDKYVYKSHELYDVSRTNRFDWRIPSWVREEDFVNLLVHYKVFKQQIISFKDREEKRYSKNQEPDPLFVAFSLQNHSFLSHYSAMFYHELTEQIPKSIFINHELTPKDIKPGKLTQEGIDYAFSKPQKASDNIGQWNDYKFFLLFSKFSDKMGIIDVPGFEGFRHKVTGLERTLIDIVVRPDYSGGIYEVEKAYRLAKDRVSINRLVAMLKKFKYTYPYHQSIGFLLERSGYKSEQIDLLRQFPRENNFYLTYNLIDKEFSRDWNLYYPKNF